MLGRRRSTATIGVCLISLILSPATDAASALVDQSATHIESLIDQFTGISKEGAGFAGLANARGFAALDQPPQFAGGILGTRMPSTPESLRDIVRIGLPALPHLLAHLKDKRPTGLSIKRGNFGGLTYFSNEMDVADYDRIRDPSGVTHNQETPKSIFSDMPNGYTLTVADLCFVAAGQIVNRSFNAIRYQPTSMVIINSPTHTPALADAAVAEWQGLTPAQHQGSLILDAYSLNYSPTAIGALQRLCFYYPETGERAALALLHRPIYDSSVTYDFVMQQLLIFPKFLSSDVLNNKDLVSTIQHPDTPLSKYLVQKMCDGTGYGALTPSDASQERIASNIAERLNWLVTGSGLYDPALFAGIQLRTETSALLASHPQGYDLRRVNRMLLEDVFPTQLVKAPIISNRDPNIWKSSLEEFVRVHGAQYRDAVRICLHSYCSQRHFSDDRDQWQVQKARRIMAALFPNFDIDRPSFVNAATQWDINNTVDSLNWYDAKSIDISILAIMNKPGCGTTDDEIWLEQECGISCVKRLMTRGYAVQCRQYCKTQLSILSSRPQSRIVKSRRNQFQSLLTKLN